MRFDLHVHSNISSCSCLALEDIIEQAGRLGLDGVCITDHQSMQAANHVREGVQENGVCLVIGMEYETPDGHFLIFGPFEDIEPGLSARDLLETVRAQKGVAIAAHPFRANNPVQDYVLRENLCHVVESLNGRNTDRENDQVDSWRGKYAFSECCGSDAHTIEEIGNLTTCFDVPIRSRKDLIHALYGGRFVPSAFYSPHQMRRIA